MPSMKLIYNLFKVVLMLLLFSGLDSYAQDYQGKVIMDSMFQKVKDIKALQFEMTKTERIEEGLVTQSTSLKINLNPFKLYSKQIRPKEGMQLLHVDGENKNETYIHSGGFPWITLSLNPYGEIMRKGQHHTIFDAGYGLFCGILKHLVTKYGEEIEYIIKVDEAVSEDGIDCWKLAFENPYFEYQDYEVQAGEDIHQIAHERFVNCFMVLKKNPSVDFYTDVKEGQVIQIPNDYSTNMIMLIDKVRLIPLFIEVYDDQGLFERYVYKDVIVNPTFNASTFDVDNPEYDF